MTKYKKGDIFDLYKDDEFDGRYILISTDKKIPAWGPPGTYLDIDDIFNHNAQDDEDEKHAWILRYRSRES